MARPSNTEQRRAEIANALVKVMARQGYEGASVASVAKAARLTPGLVHYHFKSKHEILLAALDQLAARHDERLAARLAGAPDADAVGAFIDFHLGLGADADPEALACWIMLSGEALRDRKVQAAYERAMASQAAQLAACIRRGVDAGAHVCDDVDTAASALLATIQGYFVLAAAARAVIPRGSAAAATRRMADGLLRTATPRTATPRTAPSRTARTARTAHAVRKASR